MEKPIKIRPSVMRFAEAMEKKLRKNDHKGGWDDCDYEYLFTRIGDEFAEAKEEFKNTEGYYEDEGRGIATAEELVDVANFCMMFFDNVQEDNGVENPYADVNNKEKAKGNKQEIRSRFDGIIIR